MNAAIVPPVAICEANPHYLEFRGRPIVIVTSDHHYGAVIDADFDYARYLDHISAAGFNLTRIYPGAMFEPPDKYVKGNPLGPLPGRQILPWARSDEPGANPALAEAGMPSTRFDLDRWNPAYFARLRDFVARASKHGIIVEVAFFNGMYADCWPLMPMYHANNVQGVGRYEAAECGLFTTADGRNRDVIGYQRAYVARIAEELNGFDNVIYDLCDEPSLAGKPDGGIEVMPDERIVPWLAEMRDAFLEAERPLAVHHLLGQTVQNLSPDLSAEGWCRWLPCEYVGPALRALDRDYAAGKPIVDVESDYFGHGLVKPYTADDVRAEGWWFLLSGGAGFVNLNGEYHRGQEEGGDDTRRTIEPQKRILRAFVESLGLARMSRYAGSIQAPEGTTVAAIAEPGREYAAYLLHGVPEKQWGAHFATAPGVPRSAVIVLGDVPAGAWALEWVDPATGRPAGSEKLFHPGGALTLSPPPFAMDMALRMRRPAGS